MFQSEQAKSIVDAVGEPRLEGIGGWLILLAINQAVGPLLFLFAIFSNYSILPDGTFAMFPIAFVGSLVIEFSLFFFLLYTSLLFFSKNRRFPATFIASCVVGLLQPLILAA